jgi:hypothetical protein
MPGALLDPKHRVAIAFQVLIEKLFKEALAVKLDASEVWLMNLELGYPLCTIMYDLRARRVSINIAL